MGLFDRNNEKRQQQRIQPRVANPAPSETNRISDIDQARLQLDAYRKQLDEYRIQLDSMASSLQEREKRISEKEKEMGLK